MRPGKNNRIVEGPLHAAFAAEFGILTFGEITAPGSTEAGDILWLDLKTLLIGHGYRTNANGIEQMREVIVCAWSSCSVCPASVRRRPVAVPSSDVADQPAG